MKRCYNASQKARDSITVAPLEQTLINAIQNRCPAAHPASHDFPAVDKAYANAMKEAHQSCGDDDLDA